MTAASRRESSAAEPWRIARAQRAATNVVECGQQANRPGDATNAPGHDTEEGDFHARQP